jgi:hypothetical protein
VALATHGLASVVLVLPRSLNPSDVVGTSDNHAVAESGLVAMEVWPMMDGVVSRSAIEVREFAQETACTFACVDNTDLRFDARNEVDQFNANLHYVWRLAGRFVPELRPLLDHVFEDVQEAADVMRTSNVVQLEPEVYAGYLSLLVETNACLTLLTSQLGAVLPPLAATPYCVGKYSLLGVGTAVRSLMRLYSFLNESFRKERILDQLHEMKPYPPFDRDLEPHQRDHLSRNNSQARLLRQNGTCADKTRQHIVYLSTRNGFHATTETISVSWQCLQASASREWNLLTFSHEFLHTHVSELLDEVLLPRNESELLSLCAAANKRPTANWDENSKQLLVRALQWIHLIPSMKITGLAPFSKVFLESELDEGDIQSLISNHARFLEEIVVHILDFVYFYDSNDDLFVDALWRSWGFVPFVRLNIESYVLRTLLALSVRWSPENGLQGAFDDALARLTKALGRIPPAGSGGSLAQQALRLLDDNKAKGGRRSSLWTQFQGLYDVVWWSGRYLALDSLHGSLVEDTLAAEDDEGVLAYATAVGSYLPEEIQSPVGFLLDGFRRLSVDSESEELEAASLWLLLQIT